MGKIQILTANQKIILDEITKNDYIKSRFYFTGGTALSEFYLHHRYSDDLDFFTEEKLDTEILFSWLKKLGIKYRFTFKAELPFEALYRCVLKFSPNDLLKIDFSHYFGKRVEKGIRYQGFAIDSLLDIAINKITAIQQRANVKDYADYYFLLKKFSVWDLIEGARIKFNLETDPWTLSADFLYVENFNTMPKMIKLLTLDQLKRYFRKTAKELGRKVTTR